MKFFRGKLTPTLSLMALLIGLFLLWPVESVEPENTGIEKSEINADGGIKESLNSRPHQNNKGRSPTQRVTDDNRPSGERIPRKPKVLELADSVSEGEIQRLALAWPEMDEQRSDLMRPYLYENNDDEATIKLVVNTVLEDSENDQAMALNQLGNFIYWCEDDSSERVYCNQIKQWIAKQEVDGDEFSVFAWIERLAIAGDLYAQNIYAHNLYSAVVSREVNTARDIQLWQERRQRMITYLIKFAKAGDTGSQYYLASTFSDNFLIKSNPFWAAVFYKQVKLSFGEYFPYDSLVELHQLDERLIEKARQDFFEN